MIVNRSKRMLGRLQSSSGETLVETLFAILVSSFAMLMFANAIASTRTVITNTRETAANQRTAEAALEAVGKEKKRDVSVSITSINNSIVTSPTTTSVGVYTQQKNISGYEVISYSLNEG